jgi:hypothetical protein
MSEEVISLEDERRRKADAQHVVAAVGRDTGVLTQDGIAGIFAKRYADRLRYCHSTRSWFEFDGARWRRDEINRAFEFVRQIAREVSEGKEHKELKEFRIRCRRREVFTKRSCFRGHRGLLGPRSISPGYAGRDHRSSNRHRALERASGWHHEGNRGGVEQPYRLSDLGAFPAGDHRWRPRHGEVHAAVGRLLPHRRHQRARTGVRTRSRGKRQERLSEHINRHHGRLFDAGTERHLYSIDRRPPSDGAGGALRRPTGRG